MINKYAEIQDRILLYNACKGILRVKTAEDIVTPDSADPTDPKKGWGVSSVGAGTALAAGGLGYAGSDWLTRKLGLTEDRGGWRKWLGRGVKTVGTVGSAIGGYMFGRDVQDGYTNTMNEWRASKNADK